MLVGANTVRASFEEDVRCCQQVINDCRWQFKHKHLARCGAEAGAGPHDSDSRQKALMQTAAQPVPTLAVRAAANSSFLRRSAGLAHTLTEVPVRPGVEAGTGCSQPWRLPPVLSCGTCNVITCSGHLAAQCANALTAPPLVAYHQATVWLVIGGETACNRNWILSTIYHVHQGSGSQLIASTAMLLALQ